MALLLSLHVIYTLYTMKEAAGNKLCGNNIIRPAAYAIISATVGTQSTLQVTELFAHLFSL